MRLTIDFNERRGFYTQRIVSDCILKKVYKKYFIEDEIYMEGGECRWKYYYFLYY